MRLGFNGKVQKCRGVQAEGDQYGRQTCYKER